MALVKENMALIFAGSNGMMRLWMYPTTETLSAVSAAGYFNDMTELKPGDLIAVVTVDALNPTLRSIGSAGLIAVNSV